MAKPPFVWGIGLSRTGTTSLAKALDILGYNTIHYPYSLESIEGYNAACDIPLILWFKELDQKHPESKFILTERDISTWLISCKKYFDAKPNPQGTKKYFREQIYGCTEFCEDNFRHAYYRYNFTAMEYFKDRRDDFLVLRILDGEGWEKLCDFLNCEVPKQSFPNLNKARRKLRKSLIREYLNF